VCKARRHKSNQKTVRTATLCTNPTEFILFGTPPVFEEVNVLRVDKIKKSVHIHSLKWASLQNWASTCSIAEIGWIWVFPSWGDGVKAIEELKDRYEKAQAI